MLPEDKINAPKIPSKRQNAILTDLADYLISAKGYSLNTIRSYQNDLIQFFRFLRRRFGQVDRDCPFEAIDISPIDFSLLSAVQLADIYAFLGYASVQRGNGNTTRKRKTAAIRALYHYLTVVLQLGMSDPTQNLEVPKIKQRDPIYLTLDEAMSLLNAIDGRNKERDLAIVTLFLNCGMRLSELTNLRLKDIQDETLHIVGKGNKERDVILNDACVNALEAYYPIRKQQIERIEAQSDKVIKVDDHLFLSSRGRGISNRMVEGMVHKYILKAGLDANKITVHKLRHTAATLMYKYGQVDIRTLQKVLGHENVSTTEIYTHIEDDDVRAALYKNPLAEFSPK